MIIKIHSYISRTAPYIWLILVSASIIGELATGLGYNTDVSSNLLRATWL
jgi:hypothetical protein